MNKRFLITCLAGFACGFLTSTVFSAGVPTLLMLSLEYWFGVPLLFILLGLRLITVILHKNARPLNVLLYPAAFLIGILEGAMLQALLFYSAILVSSLPLTFIKALFAIFIVLVASCAYMLAHLKKHTIAYVFMTYALVIPLGTVLHADLWKTMKKLQPYTLKKCHSLNDDGLKRVFTYPDCLKGSHADVCRKLFETGAPYDVFYHEKSERVIVTGRDSGLLLTFSGDGELLKAIDTKSTVFFISFDQYRDVLYIMTRKPGRVLEFDPESNELKKSLFSLTFPTFQRGCLLKDGDILAYSIEGLPYICIHNFKTSDEKTYRLPTFFIALPYDIECTRDAAIISFLVHTPIASEGLWVLDADREFKPSRTRRLLFPVLELTRDRDTIYAASPATGRVYAFDMNTLEIIERYKTPRGVRAIDINRDDHTLYAGSFSAGEIVKIDLKTKDVVQAWNVGPLLRNIRVSPKSKRVFAASLCGVFELIDK